MHFVAHSVSDFCNDLPVRPAAANRRNCLANSLNSAFSICKGAVLFGKAGSRQNNIGKLCCFGQEDILDKQEI